MLILDRKRYRMILRGGTVPPEINSFLTEDGKYSFPVCGDIIRRLMSADPGLELDDALSEELSTIASRQEPTLALAESDDCEGDPRLYPYQRVGVKWLLSIRRGILADEQGLGKTVMACIAAKESGAIRCLIICNGAVISQWVEHVRDWVESPVYEMPRDKSQRTEVIAHWRETGGFMVVNYARAELEEQSIYSELVIVDEAHKTRNRKTQVTESVRRIARRANWLFLLTASPTVNKIADIWPLLAMCDPKRFGSFWGFVFRFCEIDDDGYGLKVRGAKEEEHEAIEFILRPYVLHRHGILGLNPSESRVINFRMEGEQRALYRDMDKTGICTHKGATVDVMDLLAQVTRLRQLALHPGLIFADYFGPSKLDLLPGLVEERDGQVVIFTMFADLAWKAVARLHENDISAAGLTGELGDNERASALERFKSGLARVLVVTHGTGGEGLDLPNADRAIFLDLAWHPAGNEQAMRRILRIGQASTRTQITYIHAAGTVEDHIRDIIAEKRPVTISELLERGGVAGPVDSNHRDI